MGISTPTDDVGVAGRWDRAFRVLSAEPRRELALSLTDRSASTWVPLPDAAHSPHYPGSRDDLQLALYHNHLPAMAKPDYIVWEESPFEARKGPNFDELESIIRAIVDGAGDLPDRMVRNCRTLERRIDSP